MQVYTTRVVLTLHADLYKMGVTPPIFGLV